MTTKGQPRLVYMQISKNTFLELNTVTPQRPAGVSHYGLVGAERGGCGGDVSQAGD